MTDSLNNSHMMNAKHVSTPMVIGSLLSLDARSPLADGTEYRHFVGVLQYLNMSRLDIGFAVNKVAQFMHSPADVHWQAMKRILCHLKGTLSDGLFFGKVFTMSLHAFCDTEGWLSQ